MAVTNGRKGRRRQSVATPTRRRGRPRTTFRAEAPAENGVASSSLVDKVQTLVAANAALTRENGELKALLDRIEGALRSGGTARRASGTAARRVTGTTRRAATGRRAAASAASTATTAAAAPARRRRRRVITDPGTLAKTRAALAKAR